MQLFWILRVSYLEASLVPLRDTEPKKAQEVRGLPINRLIGLSRSFSLIGLGFGHLISGQNIWPKPTFFFEKIQLIFDIEN